MIMQHQRLFPDLLRCGCTRYHGHTSDASTKRTAVFQSMPQGVPSDHQRDMELGGQARSTGVGLQHAASQALVSLPAEFEQDVVHKTQCEVHIFDPTLSLGTQQQLRGVKEFNFHDTGLIAEGLKVSAAAPIPCNGPSPA